MANLRQTILIRKDLSFPIGLLAAQIAHLHMEGTRNTINEYFEKVNNGTELEKNLMFSTDEEMWFKSPYVFVHGVPNIEVLEFFEEEAGKTKIPVNVWKDTVYVDISDTQRKAFADVKIGITLGPSDSDKIKAIIGDLPLL